MRVKEIFGASVWCIAAFSAVFGSILLLSYSLSHEAVATEARVVDYRMNTSYTSGAVAMAYTFAPGRPCIVREVCVHLSAAGTAGNMTATMDDSIGDSHDAVVLTVDMSSITSSFTSLNKIMKSGDEMDFAWANGSTRIYGLQIFWEPLVAASGR